MMQDFQQCISKAVIEQFHGGKLSPQDKSAHKLIMQKLQDYVLRRLHSTLFKEPSQQDNFFSAKVDTLQWVTPSRFGVPNAEVVFKPNLWQLAIDRLKKIQLLKTPKEKCRLISQVINIIQISFKLAYDFSGKEVFAAADDLIPSIVYILNKARL